ncbi:MAG: hypothetical protein ACYSX0_13200 [Planctomycetota bacterium]
MTLKERLLNGDVLNIVFGDSLGFDVWVERYANPPRVYSEGRPFPIEELDEVLERVENQLVDEGVKAFWNGQIPVKRSDA